MLLLVQQAGLGVGAKTAGFKPPGCFDGLPMASLQVRYPMNAEIITRLDHKAIDMIYLK